MKLNFFKTAGVFLTLRGKKYPVTIQGTGPKKCFIPGIGTLMGRTLSENFFENFTVYSTDTYWIKSGALSDPTTLTMDDIVDDILSSAKQLKLGSYYLLGNSCFGTVAIEAAKRKDPGILGVIAVAAPPGWNDQVIAEATAYFEKDATPERKAKHLFLREEYEKIKRPDESIVSVGGYYADSAKYFAQDISRQEVEELWEGVEAEDQIMNHFFGKLLPDFNLAKGIDQIETPIILAAGEKDYDSAPLELWKTYPQPQNFEVLNCGYAGHWPHNENSEVFDNGVITWANKMSSKDNCQISCSSNFG